jgi:hypothetical protein
MNLEYLSGTQQAVRARQSLPHAREVEVGRVVGWLANGWEAAREHPLMWLGSILACADFVTLLGFAPVLRPLAVFFGPWLVGALMFAAARAQAGRTVSVRETFDALRARRNALIAVGLYGAVMVAIAYVFTFGLRDVLLMAPELGFAVPFVGQGFGAWVATPVFTLAVAIAWFAPALVMLDQVSPTRAIAASALAALRNWKIVVPGVFAVTVGAYLMSFAELPLQALVLMPLLIAAPMLSMHAAYRDVFGKR